MRISRHLRAERPTPSPNLSQRERNLEPTPAPPPKPAAFLPLPAEEASRGPSYSLSPRERAGVRARCRRACNVHTPHYTPSSHLPRAERRPHAPRSSPPNRASAFHRAVPLVTPPCTIRIAGGPARPNEVPPTIPMDGVRRTCRSASTDPRQGKCHETEIWATCRTRTSKARLPA
jgi:hypothetical protein